MSDQRVTRMDAAIDGAVREMLDVESRADLRGRVIARLPAAGSRLPAVGIRLSASGWVLGSMAAVTLVVLAVWGARWSEPILPQAPVTTAQQTDVRLPAAVPTSSPSTVAPARPRTPTAVAGARTIAAAAVADATTATVAIDPLNSIAPIRIAPIAQDGITAAEMAVRTLNPINEVQVAPLTPPDRR